MALEQARREGLIYRNPADDVKLPAAKPIEYTIPEPEQLQALLKELRGADAKTVSGFVGHATAQFTLNRYAHVMEQAKKKAGTLLESKVLLPEK